MLTEGILWNFCIYALSRELSLYLDRRNIVQCLLLSFLLLLTFIYFSFHKLSARELEMRMQDKKRRRNFMHASKLFVFSVLHDCFLMLSVLIRDASNQHTHKYIHTFWHCFLKQIFTWKIFFLLFQHTKRSQKTLQARVQKF